MKLKTILNAFKTATLRAVLNDEPNKDVSIRYRQFHAFRDRILRMDAEKDARIVELLQLQTKEALLRDGDYWFNRPQAKRELHHD